MNQILIIDDNLQQLDFLKNQLCDVFKIETFSNPIDALNMCKRNSFDAIVVDLHMPIINGVDFIKQFRTFNQEFKNIFILSSDNSQNAKISALNLGAIDFLWPEMSREEIILRIKNQIINSNHILTYKNIKIDLKNLIVFINQEKIDTTLIEFKLLKSLTSYPNQVISRDDLKNSVWPGMVVLDKTLNTHLTNIRSKLANTNIEIKSVKNEGIILV